MDYNIEFLKIAERIKTIKSMDEDDQLLLYGLYKQALLGDCDIVKPSSLSIVATRKYYAWKENEGMPQSRAKKQYITHAKKFLD